MSTSLACQQQHESTNHAAECFFVESTPCAAKQERMVDVAQIEAPGSNRTRTKVHKTLFWKTTIETKSWWLLSLELVTQLHSCSTVVPGEQKRMRMWPQKGQLDVLYLSKIPVTKQNKPCWYVISPKIFSLFGTCSNWFVLCINYSDTAFVQEGSYISLKRNQSSLRDQVTLL